MKNWFKLLLSCCLLIGLSACVSTGCDDGHSYRYSQAQAPIQVPDDLEQPANKSTAPQVDTSDKTNIDRRANGECLEKPPKI